MDLIDEQGRLFGVVNVVDALAVLLVIAVAVGAIVVVQGLSSDGAGTGDVEQTVRVHVTGVQPYVAGAIQEGDADSRTVVAVDNKSVFPTTVVVEADNGTLHERSHPTKQTVSMDVTLNVTRVSGSATSTPGFVVGETPLEINRTVRLDYGPVTANSTIVALDSSP